MVSIHRMTQWKGLKVFLKDWRHFKGWTSVDGDCLRPFVVTIWGRLEAYVQQWISTGWYQIMNGSFLKIIKNEAADIWMTRAIDVGGNSILRAALLCFVKQKPLKLKWVLPNIKRCSLNFKTINNNNRFWHIWNGNLSKTIRVVLTFFCSYKTTPTHSLCYLANITKWW